jgi:hypothetical protein
MLSGISLPHGKQHRQAPVPADPLRDHRRRHPRVRLQQLANFGGTAGALFDADV